MKRTCSFFLLLAILSISCCSSNDDTTEEPQNTSGLAQITKVTTSGSDGEYSFSVTISSPDLGCNQYADWWEVLDVEGNLLYRRILAHSHVNEQPFTRSGATISLAENTEVYIRAHMNNSGYGDVVFKGSIANGFSMATLATDFAQNLADLAPLPNGCAF